MNHTTHDTDTQDNAASLIEKHTRAICEAAEVLTSHAHGELTEDTRQALQEQIESAESALSHLGLCKADIYSWINRAPVPGGSINKR